ncbi:ABC transporter ATP-binding protein [Alicyclobacillus fastidiosus]|uniref:ABC transporter ATP-binding protein n=1 Tax=Alicyclobacillus fastidiosus TaxID=392011 RepID=A0ABV5ALL2_9BACL|nr:ABC transporter ATP-binding protein [Alicyclobacillus fastidiosus]WEH10589.1 ABC transporter ATP-binding protein [Alicyclobacillus fastidiosus]
MDTQAVECQRLSRRFGARAAVSDLDLKVPRGAVFGFLGSNGAGKTTTVRMMVGMLRPSAGSVQVLGLDPISQGDQVRSRCGVMLDNVGLYDRLTARQNLQFAAKIARLGTSEGRERIDELLHRVDLWERRDDKASGFSKGMRQKLGLARALISEPEMLILDEPTAGLDPASIVMVRELLVSLAQESGRTIFLCTHLLAEAQRICDRVAIMQNGHLLAIGDPNQLGSQGLPTFRLRLSGCDSELTKNLALPGGVQLSLVNRDEWRVTVATSDDIEHIVAALVGARIGVRAVIPEQVSLEEEYLRLVGGDGHE